MGFYKTNSYLRYYAVLIMIENLTHICLFVHFCSRTLKNMLKDQACILQLRGTQHFFVSRRGSYLLNFWTVGDKLDFSYIDCPKINYFGGDKKVFCTDFIKVFSTKVPVW